MKKSKEYKEIYSDKVKSSRTERGRADDGHTQRCQTKNENKAKKSKKKRKGKTIPTGT